jgi:hypothetical protein
MMNMSDFNRKTNEELATFLKKAKEALTSLRAIDQTTLTEEQRQEHTLALLHTANLGAFLSVENMIRLPASRENEKKQSTGDKTV